MKNCPQGLEISILMADTLFLTQGLFRFQMEFF